MSQDIIKDRNNQEITVVCSNMSGAGGLAFIAHGLGGSSEQPLIKVVSNGLVKAGYRTIRWDSSNRIGGDGHILKESVKSYFEDLDDVINWASSQEWYKEPFVLVGHSLGALEALIYAEEHHTRVKALVTIGAVISGKLTVINSLKPHVLGKLLKNYKGLKKTHTGTGIKPGFAKELLKYDARKHSNNLTMPILMVVGEEDKTTPLKQQKAMFKKIPKGHKSLIVVPGAGHRFRERSSGPELEKTIYEWARELG